MHKVEQSVIQDEIDMGIGLDLALYFPDPSWSEERWQEYYREVEVIHRKTIERFPKIAEYIGSREPGLDQESLSFAIRRTVTLGGYEFSDSLE
jgi:hypothetical protein